MKWFPLKRRLLSGLGPSKAKSQQANLPVQHGDKFDEATGQVYTEIQVPIPSSSDGDWTRQLRVVTEKHEQHHVGYQPLHEPDPGPFKGARSLQDQAMDTILDNVANISAEYLTMLPFPLLDWLWFELNRSGRMSFDVWKTFSKLLLNHRETTLRNMRYREAIESPRSPLAIYTSPLVSVSYEFITILSITIDFSLPELVKLSEVPNLGVLEIINTSGRDLRIVSDRLIRAWNIAALTDGAFKILRILRLWNHIGVTSKSLVYLNSFPALGVYDVRGCGFDISSPIHARRLGWKPTVDRNILNVLHAACVERAITLRAKLGLNPQPVRRASSEQLWDGAKVWKLPRTDVAAFLTRDETSRPGTPRCRLSYSTMNNIVDHLERNHPTAESRLGRSRWEALDSYLFKVSRSKMTWDFQLYSAYARLGELRDDRDLRRAGVDIGDQAMVGNELVNSVPTVSIRLGQTAPELRPSSPAAMTPKPLYGSVLASSSSSSLNRLASGPDFDPKAMCFIRVEAPSKAEISALQASLGKDKKTESHETEPSQKRKSRASMMENKKMKLGDVLGSFL